MVQELTNKVWMNIKKNARRNRFKNKYEKYISTITGAKLGAASKHFKALWSLLACCDTHIGNIGHSRRNMDSIICCIEKVINRKTAEWLSSPLPLMHLPPHYCAVADKGARSRITNQVFLTVVWDQNGTASRGCAQYLLWFSRGSLQHTC